MHLPTNALIASKNVRGA